MFYFAASVGIVAIVGLLICLKLRRKIRCKCSNTRNGGIYDNSQSEKYLNRDRHDYDQEAGRYGKDRRRPRSKQHFYDDVARPGGKSTPKNYDDKTPRKQLRRQSSLPAPKKKDRGHDSRKSQMYGRLRVRSYTTGDENIYDEPAGWKETGRQRSVSKEDNRFAHTHRRTQSERQKEPPPTPEQTRKRTQSKQENSFAEGEVPPDGRPLFEFYLEQMEVAKAEKKRRKEAKKAAKLAQAQQEGPSGGGPASKPTGLSATGQ